jgi:hypothetical protein
MCSKQISNGLKMVPALILNGYIGAFLGYVGATK